MMDILIVANNEKYPPQPIALEMDNIVEVIKVAVNRFEKVVRETAFARIEVEKNSGWG